MRFFFEISYLGTRYNGWQTQPNGKGVQEVVEDGLKKIFRSRIPITGSGRTDTGVHCAQQFFHADLELEHASRQRLTDLTHQLNSLLPRDIAIRSIRPVKPDANARYDARSRTYRYTITLRKDPLLTGLALHVFKPLDVKKMQAAADQLIGTHDFQCFSKVKTDVNHFLCDIKTAQWQQRGQLLVFTITANRFLRGMVRAVVGTLLDVGTGKISVADFREIISSRNRAKAGMNVAPEGLCLTKVSYRKGIFLRQPD